MSTYLHDPRTKLYLRDQLLDYVYSPVRKVLEQRLHKLIERNTRYGYYSHKSFVHRGKTYSMDTSEKPRLANRLVPQLADEFESWLRDQKDIEELEMPYTKGYITHVLNSSNAMPDYLKLLPEAMHASAMGYASYCSTTPKLTDKDIDLIKRAHQNSISLLKQRMVRNLLM